MLGPVLDLPIFSRSTCIPLSLESGELMSAKLKRMEGKVQLDLLRTEKRRGAAIVNQTERVFTADNIPLKF